MIKQSTSHCQNDFLILSLLGIIYLSANNLFYLVPFYRVTNVFYVRDVGNILIMVCLFFCILKYHDLGIFNDVFSFLIFYYILFVFIQAAFGSLKYEQPLIVGIIKTRDQLYYLSYFLYVYLLNTDSRINQFMEFLTIISLFLILLSLINYFGPEIFYHRWSKEGVSGLRSGIERAFIPGMGILAVSFVWQFNKTVNLNRLFNIPMLVSILLFGGIIFRQTRMLIISSALTAILMIIAKKKYKFMLFFLVLVSIGTICIGSQMKENILLSPFKSAVEDVNNGTGTWGARLIQMKVDWISFRQNMLFGSGLSTIRSSVLEKKNPKLAELAYGNDLGYTHWLKYYGITGIIWLIMVIVLFYRRYFKVKKHLSDGETEILGFAQYNFFFIVVATITQNYFFDSFRILITCLSLSILSAHYRFAMKKQSSE